VNGQPRSFMTLGLLAVLTGILLMPAALAHAQSGMLPAACAGKTGESLDKCVRDLTPPEPPRVYYKEPPPDPRRPLNCLTVNPADRNFCIARNQIIGECGNRIKHPDFDQCLTSYLSNPPVPTIADCSRISAPAQNSQCLLRNKVYKKCTADRLRYFDCLAEEMKKK
jgi:hypothetical protein